MKLLFIIVYFFLFFGVSNISGMLIPFLQYKGYEPIQIGTLISLFTLMGVFGQLFIGYFCSKFKTIKKVFLFALFITIIAGTFSFLFQKSIYFYIVFFILGIFSSILTSLIDTWVMESDEKNSFGKLRCFGSFGWAFGVLITGYIVSKFGYFMVNIIFSLSILISILSTLKLKDVIKEGNKKLGIKNLVSNKKYNFLIFSLLMVCISYRAYIQLIPYLIKYIGYDVSSLGIYYFLSSFSDILMFIICSKIMHKISPDKLLIVSPVAILIQLLIIYYTFDIKYLYISCIFQVFTFPVILMVGRVMVDRVSFKELKTTSQLVGFAMYNSLGIIIASFLVGFLVDKFGIEKSILQIIAFTIFSIFVVLIYDRKTKDEVLN